MERFTFPSREDWREGETRIRGESLHDRRHFRGSQAGRTCSTEKKPSRFSANTCNCLLTPFLAHSGRIEKRWGGGEESTHPGNKRRSFSSSSFFSLRLLSFFFPAKHDARLTWILNEFFFFLSFFFDYRERLSRDLFVIKRKEWFFSSPWWIFIRVKWEVRKIQAISIWFILIEAFVICLERNWGDCYCLIYDVLHAGRVWSRIRFDELLINLRTSTSHLLLYLEITRIAGKFSDM